MKGEKIYVGWDEIPSGAYIKYEPSYEFLNHGKEIFTTSYHPFLRKYTSNPKVSAEHMTQIPFCEAVVFSISENLLLVSSQYGKNGKMSYKETSDYIRYIADERNSESGTARFIEWYLYKTTAKKPMTVNFAPPIGVILPECEKFWIEQGHLYVLNPWHLEGVFEYYFYENQKKAGSDDFLKVETGVIYKET